MATIPSRLARITTSSGAFGPFPGATYIQKLNLDWLARILGSWPVAQARSRALYRTWYRAAPEIVTLYAANLPATAIRAKIRQQFEKNKYVDDLEAVDILLLKGYQEFQETINAWKMDSHLMRMFNDEEYPARPVTFMDKFYHGRDEGDTVQPAA